MYKRIYIFQSTNSRGPPVPVFYQLQRMSVMILSSQLPQQ